jgi:anthranilate synthase component 2
MILLIDNYDSFTYNLYQMIGAIAPDVKVVRTDEFTLRELSAWNPSRIIISPGPGRPADAGMCEAVIREFAGKVPMLGVCLGHQAICEAFGTTIGYALDLMHGKQSEIEIDTGCAIFKGLPETIIGARYHSLAAMEKTLPKALRVTARTRDGEVMAVEHAECPLYGVQFHPESVLTPLGAKILENFIGGTRQ